MKHHRDFCIGQRAANAEGTRKGTVQELSGQGAHARQSPVKEEIDALPADSKPAGNLAGGHFREAV
jgi:hypothetical protein